MKVLILSCNTGGGHNAAARAVAEAVRHMGILQKYWIIFAWQEMEFPDW